MLEKTTHKLRNIVGTKYPYKGKILDLRIDYVKFPTGDVRVREIVEHKPAVAVFVVNSEGKICLVSQYRHAVDANILEIPAGLVEEGEDFYDAAMRELQEETGYKALDMIELFNFYSSPGFSTERIHLYYASELVLSELPKEDDEYITTFWFSVEEIEAKIMSGKIKDEKTILAFYWYCLKKMKNAVV